MAQFIPKSDLLDWAKKTYLCEKASMIRKVCYKQLVEHLNTLEVKEVDLDFQMFAKEMDIVFALPSSETKNTEEEPLNWEYAIAKHFFELGVRVNNPITAADRGTAEEIIINLKKVEQDYRINLTREMEWLRNKVQKGESSEQLLAEMRGEEPVMDDAEKAAECIELEVINDWTYGKDPDHAVIPAIHYRLPHTFNVGDKVKIKIEVIKMNRKDYEIRIKADNSDNVYWQLLRKGEPIMANKQELKMVYNMCIEISSKIAMQFDGKNA